MRRLIIKIIGPFLQKFSKYYFSKPRSYRYKSLKGLVFPGVFFPHWTISTKLLLEYLDQKDLKGKSFLELGCGAGFISLLAAKKEAEVWALDINTKAIENTKYNAEANQLSIKVIESNLFSAIDKLVFDYIVINPPYYPKSPKNAEEKAWYCGENFEYFDSLFQYLPRFINSNSRVLMILSEDCAINKIQSIAQKKGIEFKEVYRKRKWGERNFIFSLKSI